MDRLRDSEAGNSVLTLHDFSVYKVSKRKKVIQYYVEAFVFQPLYFFVKIFP